MSRAYRLRVRETLRRVIRAADHVSSQLELLEILPPEQMGELLAKELTARGFERQGKKAVRQARDVTVAVDLESGKVTVRTESKQKVNLSTEQQGVIYDDVGPKRQEAESQLRDQVRQSLEKQAEEQKAQLQKQVTDRLEGELADLKQELDGAVNRATAAALKLKAAQMGQIKQLTEDAASGSLTIVVEV